MVNGHKSAGHTDSPYGGTGKTCLGGGMHCPSASSFQCRKPKKSIISSVKLTNNIVWRKYCAVHNFTVTSQIAIYFDTFRFADAYTNFPIIRMFHILSKSKIGKQLRFLGHDSHCLGKQAHRAHKTAEMLRHGIPEIITRDLRRSNSLDLNHVDYWYGSYSGTFIRDDAHVHVHTCTRPLLCKSLQKFNISINGYGGNDGIRCYKNQLSNIFERKTFIEGC